MVGGLTSLLRAWASGIVGRNMQTILLNNVCNTTVVMLALEAKINVSCRVNVIINSFAIISINSNKREMMVYF